MAFGNADLYFQGVAWSANSFPELILLVYSINTLKVTVLRYYSIYIKNGLGLSVTKRL